MHVLGSDHKSLSRHSYYLLYLTSKWLTNQSQHKVTTVFSETSDFRHAASILRVINQICTFELKSLWQQAYDIRFQELRLWIIAKIISNFLYRGLILLYLIFCKCNVRGQTTNRYLDHFTALWRMNSSLNTNISNTNIKNQVNFWWFNQ